MFLLLYRPQFLSRAFMQETEAKRLTETEKFRFCSRLE
jgi:hypothetical protein